MGCHGGRWLISSTPSGTGPKDRTQHRNAITSILLLINEYRVYLLMQYWLYPLGASCSPMKDRKQLMLPKRTIFIVKLYA